MPFHRRLASLERLAQHVDRELLGIERLRAEPRIEVGIAGGRIGEQQPRAEAPRSQNARGYSSSRKNRTRSYGAPSAAFQSRMPVIRRCIRSCPPPESSAIRCLPRRPSATTRSPVSPASTSLTSCGAHHRRSSSMRTAVMVRPLDVRRELATNGFDLWQLRHVAIRLEGAGDCAATARASPAGVSRRRATPGPFADRRVERCSIRDGTDAVDDRLLAVRVHVQAADRAPRAGRVPAMMPAATRAISIAAGRGPQQQRGGEGERGVAGGDGGAQAAARVAERAARRRERSARACTPRRRSAPARRRSARSRGPGGRGRGRPRCGHVDLAAVRERERLAARIEFGTTDAREAVGPSPQAAIVSRSG